MRPYSLLSVISAFIAVPVLAVSFVAGPVLADDDDDERKRGRVLKVDCDRGQSIQKKVDRARPGDQINVTGTCEENVRIITDHLVIHGGRTATVMPADPTVSTFTIWATNVRISGFSIIAGTDGQGVFIGHGGSGIIAANDISGSGSSIGVLVTSNSYGLIGGSFAARGNKIHGHATGIFVRNSSGSDIFFNEVYDNTRGVQIGTNGASDFSDNLIRNNTERGLNIFDGGSVTFSNPSASPGGSNVFNNNGIGIRCILGGTLGSSLVNPGQIFGTGSQANGTNVALFRSRNAGCNVSRFVGIPFPP